MTAFAHLFRVCRTRYYGMLSKLCQQHFVATDIALVRVV